MKKISTPPKPAYKLSDKIISVATLVRYLRCHQSTIYRMLKHKEISASKIGRDGRFLRSDIDEWVWKSELGPKP